MLAPGTSLGPYRILALLGAGGMGEVYRAHDTRLSRDVAIKVISAELARDPERVKRFEREACAAGALNHPNVCTVLDVGVHAGSPFVVMELLEGETLREQLNRGPLSIHKALDYAAQAAQGLAAAHEKGIAHRDLKPENLLVTREGRLKILDFGLAKHFLVPAADAQSQQPTRAMALSTRAGVLLGTVGYMSPEQARGEPADSRSDIFSFGCVLFEMLSGRRPFEKDTAVETLSAILKEDPPPLASAIGPMAPAMERIVGRCLEKRPQDRFASAHDLCVALQSLHQATSLETARRNAPEKSIVVLPFENVSPDPENAYFADGLTEEIITDLSKVRSLLVISRTSAMHYRGTSKSLPAIARELQVRYVLEGSVRRAGNSLRITAQLIEAASDGHLWAEKYTGTLDDIFDMQEKVSRAIVEALKVELTPQEDMRLAHRPIQSAYAFECYLKARREIWRWLRPSLDKAAEYLEQGLRAIPDNPLLLAGMSYVHFQRLNMGLGQKDSLQKAETLATRALELDPDLPQAHVVLGLIASWQPGKIKTAIDHFDLVLAADPNDQDALKWSGVFYAYAGKGAEAIARGERVIAIDPMSPMSYMPVMCAHWLDGRFELALKSLERACELEPGGPLETTKFFLLIPMGRRDEAFVLAERVARGEEPTIIDRMALLWRYALEGKREEALAWMPPVAWETCRRDYQYSWWAACAYVMLGDTDIALDWLENAVTVGFLNHRYLGEIDPILAPLRGNPRFQALMDVARERAQVFEG